MLLRHVVKIAVYYLGGQFTLSETFCASSRGRLVNCWLQSRSAAGGTASLLWQNGGWKTRTDLKA